MNTAKAEFLQKLLKTKSLVEELIEDEKPLHNNMDYLYIDGYEVGTDDCLDTIKKNLDTLINEVKYDKE